MFCKNRACLWNRGRLIFKKNHVDLNRWFTLRFKSSDFWQDSNERYRTIGRDAALTGTLQPFSRSFSDVLR